jgi:hypothetical protein
LNDTITPSIVLLFLLLLLLLLLFIQLQMCFHPVAEVQQYDSRQHTRQQTITRINKQSTHVTILRDYHKQRSGLHSRQLHDTIINNPTKESSRLEFTEQVDLKVIL